MDSKKLFVYGILRKRRFLKELLNTYNLNYVMVTPDTISGFVPYHSNGINMIYPVTEKQKNAYPESEFIIQGCVLTFRGTTENLNELMVFIDKLESGYKKSVVTTKKGHTVPFYIMLNDWKPLINLYGIGLVYYPDTIITECYIYADHSSVPALSQPQAEGLRMLFQ